MERKFVVKPNEMKVIDGKVVISSEELAEAIQSQIVDLNAEDEANSLILVQNSCNSGC